jgi:hypothetical protein
MTSSKQIDHWQYFNWPNILSEAKARLEEARQHPTKLTPEKDTLDYWCAWVAHANAASVLASPSPRIGEEEIARARQALEGMLALYEVFAGEDECDRDPGDGLCGAPICKVAGCAVEKAAEARRVISLLSKSGEGGKKASETTISEQEEKS